MEGTITTFQTTSTTAPTVNSATTNTNTTTCNTSTLLQLQLVPLPISLLIQGPYSRIQYALPARQLCNLTIHITIPCKDLHCSDTFLAFESGKTKTQTTQVNIP